MSRVKKSVLRREDVERFDELHEKLKSASSSLDGRLGVSAFNVPETAVTYEQLQFHLDRALRWADELEWIIDRELLPPVMREERAAAS